MKRLKVLQIADVAALLAAEPAAIEGLAQKGHLPGARIGNAWIFLEKDVFRYLRDAISHQTSARRRSAEEKALIPTVKAEIPRPNKQRQRPTHEELKALAKANGIFGALTTSRRTQRSPLQAVKL